MTIRSQCESCAHVQLVTSPRGGRYLLCRMAKRDARFSKYPPQPMRGCSGFAEAREAPEPEDPAERSC